MNTPLTHHVCLYMNGIVASLYRSAFVRFTFRTIFSSRIKIATTHAQYPTFLRKLGGSDASESESVRFASATSSPRLSKSCESIVSWRWSSASSRAVSGATFEPAIAEDWVPATISPPLPAS